jgi:predicted Fe-Mo cluster-binding NifX family protein
MKICVPSHSGDGLASVVAGHLGRAPLLTLVDTEEQGRCRSEA